jgi:glutathione-regulated potassium-efflux system ancillary protein KefG
MMSKTLVLLFHPNLPHSKANAALAGAATAMSNTEVVDMYAAYPGGIDMYRDGETEAARLLAADHIVLQFPVQWYSTPPLLKAWQDAVLT